MSPLVPGRLCLAGMIFSLLLRGKAVWPHFTFPGEITFNTVCQAIAVCLLSASVFLGLYGFCVSPTVKRVFLLYCFVGSLLLSVDFFSNFMMYTFVSRTLNKFDEEPKMQMLAKTIEVTRVGASNRAIGARVAYVMFGIELPYRKDDLTWTYYEPTAEDKTSFENVRGMNAAISNLRQKSKGLLAGAENTVLYSFITFLFGLLWLAVKRPVNPANA